MANEVQQPQLTQKKENLQRNAELRQKDSKFVKIQPREKRVFRFDPEKIYQCKIVSRTISDARARVAVSRRFDVYLFPCTYYDHA